MRLGMQNMQLFGRVAIELLDGGLEAELHAAQGRPATEAPFNFTTCYHGCGGLKSSEVHYRMSTFVRCWAEVICITQSQFSSKQFGQFGKLLSAYQTVKNAVMFLQELEELCSESARLCNRLRAKLEPEACLQMDQELAALAPIFQLKARPLAYHRALLYNFTACQFHSVKSYLAIHRTMERRMLQRREVMMPVPLAKATAK